MINVAPIRPELLAAKLEPHLDVVIGPVAPSRAALEALAKDEARLTVHADPFDMAELMGLIGLEAAKNLHTMREVRNHFAHKLEVINFYNFAGARNIHHPACGADAHILCIKRSRS